MSDPYVVPLPVVVNGTTAHYEGACPEAHGKAVDLGSSHGLVMCPACASMVHRNLDPKFTDEGTHVLDQIAAKNGDTPHV